jgi:hypothetical protein
MFISPKKILKSPAIMDQIEEPYVIVTHTGLLSTFGSNQDVLDAINLIYWQGWETVNFSFLGAQMNVMVKNPRPRRKNQPNQG